jgi:Cu(I)/Ag(I) efflux system membrane fusion protein
MRNERGARGGAAKSLIIAFSVVVSLLAGLVVGLRFGDRLRPAIGWPTPPQDDSAPGGTTGAKQLWTCGMHPQVIQEHPGDCPICHMKLTPIATENAAEGRAGDGQRRIKYWWDPMMNPPYISSEPGKSPMGMDLVPVYDDEVAAGRAVSIDPVVAQNMGLRVAPVRQGPLLRTIRAVGYLGEVEGNRRDVNLRVSGWIERLYADTEGMQVQKGDALFELYSPELQVAAEELIAAARQHRRHASPSTVQSQARDFAVESLYDAAVSKLSLLGLTNEQIAEVQSLEEAPSTFTFVSPMTGHVVEKPVVQGASLKAGERVMRIVDHSQLWLSLRIFEQDLPFIFLGQRANAVIDSAPGQVFVGEINFIHPHVDDRTRTAQARLVVANPDMQLRPGMYARVTIACMPVEHAVLVPREAVIDTGVRQVAFIAVESPGRAQRTFEPRNVKLGLSGDDGMVQVLEGVAPGEIVVTSGQFMLDSESRFREAIQKQLSGGVLLAERSVGQAARADRQARLPWTAEIDAVVARYLRLAERLGEIQETDAPLDINPLLAEAQSLLAHSSDERARLAKDVLDATLLLKDQSLAEQRANFKPLSHAVIALADAAPPSDNVAPKLYVMYCPMVKAYWLQVSETLANPYYATEMKLCGEINRNIETRSRSSAGENVGGSGGQP